MSKGARSPFARINRSGRGKVSIGSMDGGPTVHAHYNPKELQIDKAVPWSKVNEANQSNSLGGLFGGGGGGGEGIHLEFTGAEGRTVTLELLFDGYEQGGVNVGQCVRNLETLASVIRPGSMREDDRRPHRCIVVWGEVLDGFKCVIESLSTKYTMFSESGEPLRATCTVKLKEADIVSGKKPGAPGGAAGPGGAGGTGGTGGTPEGGGRTVPLPGRG
jgi:hypothetical protein